VSGENLRDEGEISWTDDFSVIYWTDDAVGRDYRMEFGWLDDGKACAFVGWEGCDFIAIVPRDQIAMAVTCNWWVDYVDEASDSSTATMLLPRWGWNASGPLPNGRVWEFTEGTVTVAVPDGFGRVREFTDLTATALWENALGVSWIHNPVGRDYKMGLGWHSNGEACAFIGWEGCGAPVVLVREAFTTVLMIDWWVDRVGEASDSSPDEEDWAEEEDVGFSFKYTPSNWASNFDPKPMPEFHHDYEQDRLRQEAFDASRNANQSDRTGGQCDMSYCTNPGEFRFHGDVWYCGIHIREINR